eukprot:gene39036-23983_t
MAWKRQREALRDAQKAGAMCIVDLKPIVMNAAADAVADIVAGEPSAGQRNEVGLAVGEYVRARQEFQANPSGPDSAARRQRVQAAGAGLGRSRRRSQPRPPLMRVAERSGRRKGERSSPYARLPPRRKEGSSAQPTAPAPRRRRVDPRTAHLGPDDLCPFYARGHCWAAAGTCKFRHGPTIIADADRGWTPAAAAAAVEALQQPLLLSEINLGGDAQTYGWFLRTYGRSDEWHTAPRVEREDPMDELGDMARGGGGWVDT